MMSFRRLLSVFGLVLIAGLVVHAAGSVACAQDKYALVVGHNIGQVGDEPLHFAEQDARRLGDVLTRLGGVSSARMEVLLRPNRAGVLLAFERLASRLKSNPLAERATVYFYFAGHGDAQSLKFGREVVTRAEINDRLKRLPGAFKMALIDACETPASRARGVRVAPSFDVSVIPSSSARGVVVIRSTGQGEPAMESDALGGAVFSHFFLSALQGAADYDHDGRVTLQEAYSLTYRQTVHYSARGASSAIQHPSYQLELAGAGDVVLTVLKGAQSRLIIPAHLRGRFMVYDKSSGSVMAEAHSDGRAQVALALPKGAFIVQRRTEDAFFVAEIDLPYGGQRALQKQDFVTHSYEEVTLRGGHFELHPHALRVGYEFLFERLPGKWVPRHGAMVNYRYLLGRLFLGATLAGHFAGYDTEFHNVNELDAALRLALGWSAQLGVTQLELGAGPTVHWMQQQRQRIDHESLARLGSPLANKQTENALGVGAHIYALWSIPLGYGISAFPAVGATLTGLKINDGDAQNLRAVPAFYGNVGLGYRF